jgi:hypothetical protein
MRDSFSEMIFQEDTDECLVGQCEGGSCCSRKYEAPKIKLENELLDASSLFVFIDGKQPTTQSFSFNVDSAGNVHGMIRCVADTKTSLKFFNDVKHDIVVAPLGILISSVVFHTQYLDADIEDPIVTCGAHFTGKLIP